MKKVLYILVLVALCAGTAKAAENVNLNVNKNSIFASQVSGQKTVNIVEVGQVTHSAPSSSSSSSAAAAAAAAASAGSASAGAGASGSAASGSGAGTGSSSSTSSAAAAAAASAGAGSGSGSSSSSAGNGSAAAAAAASAKTGETVALTGAKAVSQAKTSGELPKAGIPAAAAAVGSLGLSSLSYGVLALRKKASFIAQNL